MIRGPVVSGGTRVLGEMVVERRVVGFRFLFCYRNTRRSFRVDEKIICGF